MKRFIIFIFSFIPWLLSGLLFSSNFSYYDEINKPFFALPKFLFSPVWTIIYILIAISITTLIINNYIKCEKDYLNSLIFNYIFNQLYLFFFFVLKSPFLGFVDSVLILITSLFLYYETKELNKKASKFLILYTWFNVYACILSLAIYFLNL